jgi:hypothetical protein
MLAVAPAELDALGAAAPEIQAVGDASSKELLPNILLVDDDRLSRRLVSSLLIACGYQGASPRCHKLRWCSESRQSSATSTNASADKLSTPHDGTSCGMCAV